MLMPRWTVVIYTLGILRTSKYFKDKNIWNHWILFITPIKFDTYFAIQIFFLIWNMKIHEIFNNRYLSSMGSIPAREEHKIYESKFTDLTLLGWCLDELYIQICKFAFAICLFFPRRDSNPCYWDIVTPNRLHCSRPTRPHDHLGFINMKLSVAGCYLSTSVSI